mmetsp:Transcript_17256/g.44954  ORF Transcript_17256/g.44954 Transcript_17256/m.44954 type:complete len:1284 (+) Transcript_17256:143-3994(+)
MVVGDASIVGNPHTAGFEGEGSGDTASEAGSNSWVAVEKEELSSEELARSGAFCNPNRVAVGSEGVRGPAKPSYSQATTMTASRVENGARQLHARAAESASAPTSPGRYLGAAESSPPAATHGPETSELFEMVYRVHNDFLKQHNALVTKYSAKFQEEIQRVEKKFKDYAAARAGDTKATEFSQKELANVIKQRDELRVKYEAEKRARKDAESALDAMSAQGRPAAAHGDRLVSRPSRPSGSQPSGRRRIGRRTPPRADVSISSGRPRTEQEAPPPPDDSVTKVAVLQTHVGKLATAELFDVAEKLTELWQLAGTDEAPPFSANDVVATRARDTVNAFHAALADVKAIIQGSTWRLSFSAILKKNKEVVDVATQAAEERRCEVETIVFIVEAIAARLTGREPFRQACEVEECETRIQRLRDRLVNREWTQRFALSETTVAALVARVKRMALQQLPLRELKSRYGHDTTVANVVKASDLLTRADAAEADAESPNVLERFLDDVALAISFINEDSTAMCAQALKQVKTQHTRVWSRRQDKAYAQLCATLPEGAAFVADNEKCMDLATQAICRLTYDDGRDESFFTKYFDAFHRMVVREDVRLELVDKFKNVFAHRAKFAPQRGTLQQLGASNAHLAGQIRELGSACSTDDCPNDVARRLFTASNALATGGDFDLISRSVRREVSAVADVLAALVSGVADADRHELLGQSAVAIVGRMTLAWVVPNAEVGESTRLMAGHFVDTVCSVGHRAADDTLTIVREALVAMDAAPLMELLHRDIAAALRAVDAVSTVRKHTDAADGVKWTISDNGVLHAEVKVMPRLVREGGAVPVTHPVSRAPVVIEVPPAGADVPLDWSDEIHVAGAGLYTGTDDRLGVLCAHLAVRAVPRPFEATAAAEAASADCFKASLTESKRNRAVYANRVGAAAAGGERVEPKVLPALMDAAAPGGLLERVTQMEFSVAELRAMMATASGGKEKEWKKRQWRKLQLAFHPNQCANARAVAADNAHHEMIKAVYELTVFVTDLLDLKGAPIEKEYFALRRESRETLCLVYDALQARLKDGAIGALGKAFTVSDGERRWVNVIKLLKHFVADGRNIDMPSLYDVIPQWKVLDEGRDAVHLSTWPFCGGVHIPPEVCADAGCSETTIVLKDTNRAVGVGCGVVRELWAEDFAWKIELGDTLPATVVSSLSTGPRDRKVALERNELAWDNVILEGVELWPEEASEGKAFLRIDIPGASPLEIRIATPDGAAMPPGEYDVTLRGCGLTRHDEGAETRGTLVIKVTIPQL